MPCCKFIPPLNKCNYFRNSSTRRQLVTTYCVGGPQYLSPILPHLTARNPHRPTSWQFWFQTIPLLHQRLGWHQSGVLPQRWHQCSLCSLQPIYSTVPHSSPPGGYKVCKFFPFTSLLQTICQIPIKECFHGEHKNTTKQFVFEVTLTNCC